jgi:cadmium resistance protein CadD (predicted permease)
VHAALSLVLVALAAFVGTMTDNFAVLTAQLALTDREKFRRVGWGHFIGMATVILAAALVGFSLEGIPTSWVGLLAVAPLGLAVHAWRHRHDATRVSKRGATTTFLITLSLGGDNLAVWVPLFRAAGTAHETAMVIIFLLADGLFIVAAQALGGHERTTHLLRRFAPHLTPVFYLLLAVLVLFQCHTI